MSLIATVCPINVFYTFHNFKSFYFLHECPNSPHHVLNARTGSYWFEDELRDYLDIYTIFFWKFAAVTSLISEEKIKDTAFPWQNIPIEYMLHECQKGHDVGINLTLLTCPISLNHPEPPFWIVCFVEIKIMSGPLSSLPRAKWSSQIVRWRTVSDKNGRRATKRALSMLLRTNFETTGQTQCPDLWG